MQIDLEEKINKSDLVNIELEEDIKIELTDINEELISINRSNIVIEGMNRKIEINVSLNHMKELAIFYLSGNVNNVEFRNMNIEINILGEYNKEFIYCIKNQSSNLKISNCNIIMKSYCSQNLIAVYNNGNDDTHMETRADYLVVEKSNIRINCNANGEYKPSIALGIYNSLSNSISIINTFINIINKGEGSNQKAIGIFTNGRFGRIIGNNIKANSSHPEGVLLEQAHSYGIINEGLYTIISNNNIIAEWAGAAVSVENKGDSALINGNKILATHTIRGSGVINSGEKAVITNNIIISTSKNAKLIEHNASNSIISNNQLEVLIPPNECVSGVGIYAPSKYIGFNIITENIISNVKNCGIFTNKNVGTIFNNQVLINMEAINIAGSDDFRLYEVLNERNIKSIRREVDE